jgi:hypothetical protein
MVQKFFLIQNYKQDGTLITKIPQAHNLSWHLHISGHEFEEWKHSQMLHILCFDGASKGNLGVTGVGGVLFSP